MPPPPGVERAPDAEQIAGRVNGVVRVLDEVAPVVFPIWLVSHRELRTSRCIRVVFEALARGLAAGTQLCVAQNLASAGQRIARAAAGQWSPALRAPFADKAPTLFLLGRTAA